MLYACTERLGGFLETLARFRPDLEVVAGIAVITPDPADPPALAPGEVPRSWVGRRGAGVAGLSGTPFAVVGHSETLAYLRTAMATRVLHYSLGSDFDRRLTAALPWRSGPQDEPWGRRAGPVGGDEDAGRPRQRRGTCRAIVHDLRLTTSQGLTGQRQPIDVSPTSDGDQSRPRDPALVHLPRPAWTSQGCRCDALRSPVEPPSTGGPCVLRIEPDPARRSPYPRAPAVTAIRASSSPARSPSGREPGCCRRWPPTSRTSTCP